MSRVVKRAYKYRFYPTPDQAAELSRTFGCVRVVYNKALAERTRLYRDEGKRASYNDTSAWLTAWKRDPELRWLSEVSSVPLQQSLMHLNRAFMNFFDKRAGYPKFKSKRSRRDAAEYTYRAFNYRHEEGQAPTLRLAKMSAPLHVVWHRTPPDGVAPTTVTVTREPSGRWFVSLLFDDTMPLLPVPTNTGVVGVDFGQGDLVVSATQTLDGDAANVHRLPGLMPRARLEKKLARAQRVYSRTKRGSKNRAKAARKVARIHAKIADQRRDFLHKTSLNLLRENQAVGIEDLDVRGMTVTGKGSVEAPGTGVRRKAVRNRRNLDVGYRMLRTMLEYKANWYGRDVILVDRFYPSTRLCSTRGCDYLAPHLPTSVRMWTCPSCGAVHDRDENAAANICAAATAVRACGDGVRPRKRRALAGKATVRETGNLGREAQAQPFSAE